MTLIKITSIPNRVWTVNSSWEYELMGKEDLEKASTVMYEVVDGDISFAVLGLQYSSLTSPPVFWFFLTQAFDRYPIAGIKALKACVEELPKGTVTVVASDFAAGCRFARWFGFSPSGEMALVNSRDYEIWRRD